MLPLRFAVASGPERLGPIGGAISREMEHAGRLYSSEVEAGPPGELAEPSCAAPRRAARLSCIMDHAAFCGTVIQREAPCTPASRVIQLKINRPQLFGPRTAACRRTRYRRRSVAVTPICDGLQRNRSHNCAPKPFLVAFTDSMCSTSPFPDDYRSFAG